MSAQICGGLWDFLVAKPALANIVNKTVDIDRSVRRDGPEEIRSCKHKSVLLPQNIKKKLK